MTNDTITFFRQNVCHRKIKISSHAQALSNVFKLVSSFTYFDHNEQKKYKTFIFL